MAVTLEGGGGLHQVCVQTGQWVGGSDCAWQTAHALDRGIFLDSQGMAAEWCSTHGYVRTCVSDENNVYISISIKAKFKLSCNGHPSAHLQPSGLFCM